MRACVCVVLCGAIAFGTTLPEAVDLALKNYPSIRVSQQQTASRGGCHSTCADGVSAAGRCVGSGQSRDAEQRLRAAAAAVHSAYDLRAAKPENDLTNVWGSAVGFLVSWEPFDFGLRRANIEAAEAGRVHAEATVERTRLDVATAAADAYLTYLAAQQTLLAAEAQRGARSNGRHDCRGFGQFGLTAGRGCVP